MAYYIQPHCPRRLKLLEKLRDETKENYFTSQRQYWLDTVRDFQHRARIGQWRPFYTSDTLFTQRNMRDPSILEHVDDEWARDHVIPEPIDVPVHLRNHTKEEIEELQIIEQVRLMRPNTTWNDLDLGRIERSVGRVQNDVAGDFFHPPEQRHGPYNRSLPRIR